MEKTKRIFSESAVLNEFIDAYNIEYEGHHTMWYDGEFLYFSYPACYCSCVKRMDKPLSKTWCYCTLAYTKKLFDYALDCGTDVELIESIKTGGSKCVIRVTKHAL